MKRRSERLRALRTLLLLCLLVVVPNPADASAPPPLRLQMEVDRWNLAIDEELDLRVEIHGVYDRYIPPSFENFDVIASFKKKRSELRKGKHYEWREVHYRLRPKALDKLAIGGAQIKLGGKVIAKAQELVVTVTNPPAAMSAQEARRTVDAPTQRPVLRVRTDKDSYWVGEPIVVSWDLLSEKGQDVRPVSVERAPRMDGIARRENLTFDSNGRDIELGGKEVRIRSYSRVVAYKGEPGRLVIDAMRLLVKTDDGFGTARLVTRPFYVDVKSLPKGQPSSFSPHQLGSFTLKSRITNASGQKPTACRAGDVLYVDVQVTGRGNLQGIKAPRVEDSEHFALRQVAAIHQESFVKDGKGISGTRQFRFELKPRTVGQIPLPKVTFAFFDPSTEAYVVRKHTHGHVKVESVMQLLYGGQLLEGTDKRGVRLEVGWPHTSLTYVLPITDKLELSPKLTLRYGHLLEAKTVAFEPGFEFRWKLMNLGGWKLAFVGDPGLILEFPEKTDDMELGFRLGTPGLMASLEIAPMWNLSLGLRVPLAFIFGDETRVLIPLLAEVGADTQVVDERWKLNVGALISGGPEFCAGPCDGVGMHLRFSMTTSVIW